METESVITDKKLSSEEARRLLLRGEIIIGSIIDGGMYVGYCDLPRVIIKNATIRGGFTLEKMTIENNVRLDGTFMEYLKLSEMTIKGDLYLYDVFFPSSGYINLRGLKLKGELWLVMKQQPKYILVSPDMAELIHLAVPTVPIVVRRR